LKLVSAPLTTFQDVDVDSPVSPGRICGSSVPNSGARDAVAGKPQF